MNASQVTTNIINNYANKSLNNYIYKYGTPLIQPPSHGYSQSIKYIDLACIRSAKNNNSNLNIEGLPVNNKLIYDSETHIIYSEEHVESNSWISKYILSQPPAPTIDNITGGILQNNHPFKNKIKWVPPVQVKVGIFDEKLPVLKQLHIDLSGTPILDSSNVDITELHLIRGIGTSGVDNNNIYIYYNLSLVNAINPLKIWYTNNSNISSIDTLTIENILFNDKAGPSTPGLTIRNISNNITISITAPTSVLFYGDDDIGNMSPSSTDAPSIVKYKIRYKPNSSIIRYNGVYNTYDTNIDSYNTSDIDISGLYPDTTYDIYLIAVNSFDMSSNEVNSTFTTAGLPFTGKNISGANITMPIRHNSNDAYMKTAKIGNVYYNSESIDISFNNVATRIYDNRGLLNGNGKVTSVSINTDTLFNIMGYPGNFNDKSSYISNISTSDTVSGSISSNGFYSDMNFTIAYNLNNVVQHDEITLPVTQTYYNSEGNTIYNASNNSIKFYADDFNKNIKASLISINIDISDNSGWTQISGLWVSKGVVMLAFSNIDISGIGGYFHAQTPLSFNFLNTTGNTINILSLLGDNKLDGIFPINGTLYTSLNYNLFKDVSGEQISIQMTNLNNTTSVIKQLDKQFITDYPSVSALIKFSETVLSSNDPSSYGERMQYIDISTTYTVDTSYNNTNDISSNDLLFSNAKFTTSGYKNYSTYFKNIGKNYSNTNDYRYAVFRWKFKKDSSYTITQIDLSIIDLSGGTKSIYNNMLYVDNYPVKLYYMISDSTSIVKNGISTIWINANSITDIDNFINLYYKSDYNTNVGGGGPSIDNTLVIYNLACPQFVVNNNSTYLYAIIGLCMNTTISFSYISAKILQSPT